MTPLSVQDPPPHVLSCSWKSCLCTSLPPSPHWTLVRSMPALYVDIFYFPRHGYGEAPPSPAFRGVGAARDEGVEERSCWAGSTEPALTLKLCLGSGGRRKFSSEFCQETAAVCAWPLPCKLWLSVKGREGCCLQQGFCNLQLCFSMWSPW